jgi:hypothetical protein
MVQYRCTLPVDLTLYSGVVLHFDISYAIILTGFEKLSNIFNYQACQTTFNFCLSLSLVSLTTDHLFISLSDPVIQVLLEKMALILERKRLMESNNQLQKELEKYFDQNPTVKRRMRNTLSDLVFSW